MAACSWRKECAGPVCVCVSVGLGRFSGGFYVMGSTFLQLETSLISPDCKSQHIPLESPPLFSSFALVFAVIAVI